jgi:sugar lactone lactonase YvrE
MVEGPAMSVRIEAIGDRRYKLGEGPLWDGEEGALYGVDVVGMKVWRYGPNEGAYREWPMPDVVSSIALREEGGAIVTLSDGFFMFDFESGECERIGEPIEPELNTRFNDGKVDRQGRFIAGTMDNRIGEPLGSIYRLDGSRTVATLDRGMVCSNGPCWSEDGRTFYFTDSMRARIYAYDYDTATGEASNRRVHMDFADHGIDCAPDGCTVDAEGHLWSALCLAGKIARIAPDGTLERAVDMPVKSVTSVMFGGDSLDILYVTSLSIPLRKKPPEEATAGALFAVKGLGVRGTREPRFKG